MRVAVFGTGGAGGYFGAKLARSGEEVVFIARGKHLEAIRAHGLVVESAGGEVVVRPAQATDDPVQVGPVDVVLVGVKAWQVPGAGASMRPLIGPQTFVVPLQNGVEAPAQLAAAVGEDHVVGGLCGTLSWVAGPGRIRTVGKMHFVKFAELDNRSSERTARLREAFERAGVNAEIPADIHLALWEKFLFVVSFGGVGSVTRAPVGIIRSIPETRGMLERCMHEILAVGQARGVALGENAVGRSMALVDSLDPSGTTSLQRDLADGKPSELEAWNGAVVRLGREAGVATPTHEFIYQSLLPAELRARGKVEYPVPASGG
ncbi:MAG TPA: 2-dehydropantoate 2-reductase [Thermoanaerobaculia bacterium]|nr:2-dehydropantoate 2-reductase [Thermoanaerobaculia bacterium]